MKNKIFGLYFSNQKHFHLMFFFSSLQKYFHLCVSCLIVKAGGSIVNRILANTPILRSYAFT